MLDFAREFTIARRGNSARGLDFRGNSETFLGETVRFKLANISKIALLGCTAVCVWLAGCSGGGTANVVVVTLSPQSATLVVNQSINFVAIVTGATDTSVTWTCTFTTSTTPAGSTTPVVSAAAPCTAAQGVLSNTQPTTVTYTAPASVPNPPPTITITGTSNADKKKTGTATITLDSGIRVTIIPATATVATGSSFQFHPTLTNDPLPNDVTWLVMQATATNVISPTAASCSPGCGSIDATGLYTAPATVPSTATVTVIATSKLDTTRFATATVTVVQAGPITFSNVSPSVAPQGGLFQDIFLTASNLTSSGVAVSVSGVIPPIDPLSQVKVIFGPSSSSSSVGARVRLNAQQLAVAGSFTVSITSTNPASPVTTVPGGNFTVNVVPVTPSVVASDPQSFPQSSQIVPGFQGPAGPFMSIDGGYYGPPTNEVAFAQLNGTTLVATSDPKDPNISTPRRLNVTLPNLANLPNGPGLYPVTVTNHNASPSTAYTNIAIVPDYANTNVPGTPTVISLPAGSAPSAIAEDSVLGVAVIAETGTSSIQFVDMRTAKPALLGGPIPTGSIPASTAPGSLPTGVAVDETLHIAAVVNYADRSLWIFQIPTPPAAPSATALGKIDLSTLIPATAPTTPPSAPPFPYSVGIDSQTHRGIIAFASTNVGFIVNLDPAQPASVCLPSQPPASAATYCPIASVTLNTGSNPQIALEPRVDLAYVTPGGGGNLSVVDLHNVATQARIPIATATRTSDIVTVTTSTPHNLNPGNPGTVLISGLPAGKNGTIFDGTFSVTSVIDASTFTYSETAADDTTSSTTASPGFVTYGTAFLTYSLTPTVQGIAINPVSRTAVLADPNADRAQISFIDSLDQAVTSLTLFSETSGVPGTGLPAESGVADVAFQPFTNTAVSFNPVLGEVSMIDPVLLQRDAIVKTGQNGLKTISFTNSGVAVSLKLTGALQVDPNTNTVLVANSGSDNLTYFILSTSFKAVNIEQVVTPPVPGALLPQAAITTSGSTPGAISGVRILGSGFDAGSLVRLDGQSVPATFVSAREIDATIPSSFLTAPRRFALDVVNSIGVVSNNTDFSVIEAVPIPACSGTASAPGAVAIDEQRNIAVVSDFGCSDASIISLKPDSTFGTLTHRIGTGAGPAAVAVIPRFGFAVISNNTAGTVSILNLDTNAQAASDVTVGTKPNGVAIDQQTAIALVANTGSNTVSALNLEPLLATPVGAVTTSSIAVNQNPIAVAIDPDRGTNNRGEAVVTSLILNGSGLPPSGGLDVVDLGVSPPSKNASASLTQIQATPTGIIFDPATTLFFATSSQGNTISAFNPDNGQSQSIPVGINPTSLAYNYQSSTILTVNSLSNTVSIVDSQTFRTRATLGISASSQFAAAIHPVTNLAVIADQANNRVLLLPLP
jgi:DNA-binding beta-propeller fold protein YncE